MSRRRAFVIVLDACGAGELPDSADYGDAGADTLVHVAQAVGGLDLPVMERLGLGAIVPIEGVAPAGDPVLHGRLHPVGPGKDTIAGHWELMGVVAGAQLPVYPDGFPEELLGELQAATGERFIGNVPSNGIAILDELGEEHLRTGALILYTSADSVLQIAAHENVIPCGRLHEVCAAAREVMRGERAVGRVIARPFEGRPGAFTRTAGRRDFALRPPSRSYLEELGAAGIPVHSVGKVGDVFAGVGIDERHPGATNAEALAATRALIDGIDHGLVFTNLVETDQLYGHRKDVHGFHRALRGVDDELGEWLGRLDPERDLLILTADHGCDPAMPGTDHTREHAPLLARFAGHGGRRHDGPLADVGASVLKWLAGREADLPGRPFL